MIPALEDWFARRTWQRPDWSVADLVAAKAGRRVSVVLPALDEQATVGAIVAAIVPFTTGPDPLVDELVVVDSGSTDATRERAAEAGARVVCREDVLPELPPRAGKGEVLWRSLAATTGDLVVFLDSDLVDFDPGFVPALLGPLLTVEGTHLVKGFYRRPLRLESEELDAESSASGTNLGAESSASGTNLGAESSASGTNLGAGSSASGTNLGAGSSASGTNLGAESSARGTNLNTGGGRVTELLARPLLAALRPELSGIVQPLGGEYAGTRWLLESVPFAAGYGVEVGLLLDTHARFGLDALAQVNLGVRKHRNRSLLALGVMARQILAAVLHRCGVPDSGGSLTQFRQLEGEWLPDGHRVEVADRPPMREVLAEAERARR